MRIKKELAYGILIWLAAFFIITGLSGLIHRTSTVFLLGGSTNVFLSMIITLIIFGVSFFIMAKMPREAGYVTQFIAILITYFIACIFLLRGFTGFFPWEIELILSAKMKLGIFIKVVLILVASCLGSYLGTKLGGKTPRK